jgi:hypothetical protein
MTPSCFSAHMWRPRPQEQSPEVTELRWLHEMRMKDYRRAAVTLSHVATAQASSLLISSFILSPLTGTFACCQIIVDVSSVRAPPCMLNAASSMCPSRDADVDRFRS